MPAPTIAQSAVSLSREEAKAILEGLEMLLNSRRFSFKRPSESSDELHAELIHVVGRVRAEFHRVFGLE